MAIPDFQTLMLPVLRLASTQEVRIGDAVDVLAQQFSLSEDELAELLPSGRQSIFSNRVHWARTYLKQAGLIEATRRAHFRITDQGRKVLDNPPQRIDVNFLSQFEGFNQFRYGGRDNQDQSQIRSDLRDSLVDTPDIRIRKAFSEMNFALGQDLIDRVRKAPPAFFEQAIVSLLLSMGYGGSAKQAGKAIGKSGDDGIDGVVDQDALGLDRVYVQAKRYAADNNVGPGAIRDFFGSLNLHNAAKGIFFTTSDFSKSAYETADRLGARIVLINGELLSHLMIRYGVGCRSVEVIDIKRIDEDFFDF